MYHGTPEDRAELRRTSMSLSRRQETQPKKKQSTRTKKRRITKRRDSDSDDDIVVVEVEDEGDSTDDEDLTTQKSTFPVIITTYEMVIKDRKHLAKYDWGQVIVDEGHRLKNMDSILMREIKKYPSAGRMLLTGTPLHVSPIPLSNSTRFHDTSRTTWPSSGLSLTSFFQKSSTMSRPSKTREFLPLHAVYFSCDVPQVQGPDA